MVENKDNQNENNVTYEELQNRNNSSEINVVNTVNTEKDLADKTIETVESVINTQDHIYEFTQEEVNKYKKSALLCYIPFVVFYFIFTGIYKKTKYMLFHSNQGLIVTIIWLITIIVNKLSNAIFEGRGFVMNTTPGIVSFIIYILYCISFILSIYGIINTVNGRSKELLLIGHIKFLK